MFILSYFLIKVKEIEYNFLVKFEFSAGGVVYRKNANNIVVLVAQHSQHHGWVFPKGLIADKVKNESKEETAAREVEEETGIKARIIQPLTPTEYWYQFEDQKIKKTVYYFVMEYISGDFTDRDFEMDAVEWVPIEEVEEKLTYPSDKNVWSQARKMIK